MIPGFFIIVFPLPSGFDLSSNPIQFKVLSARFYPHWLNHRNAVLFRETNPANSRRTPDTTLTCRRRGHETHSEKSLTRLMTHKNKQRKRSDIQQSNSDKSRAGSAAAPVTCLPRRLVAPKLTKAGHPATCFQPLFPWFPSVLHEIKIRRPVGLNGINLVFAFTSAP